MVVCSRHQKEKGGIKRKDQKETIGFLYYRTRMIAL